MSFIWNRFYIFFSVFMLSTQALAVPNPVLDFVADAGVMRYNGEYYLMGVNTVGQMYVSDNLIDWRGPFHAAAMDNSWATGDAGRDSEIHASDFKYINGTFHHYWSVNFQDLRQIGHAVSFNPLGPYIEPVKNKWFSGRIDPYLFVDDDGKMYFYTVKFTDGNVIWGRRMDDPWTLVGEPVELLSTLADTWENLDQPPHRVNEAPWVIKYRDLYYLLYNANHTAASYGHYGIGCATATTPLGFSNATKYLDPVLRDNKARVDRGSKILLPTSRKERQLWHYTTTQPGAEWYQTGFDDSAWQEGPGGFGTPVPQSVVGTEWRTHDIWLRREFSLEEKPSPNTQLMIHHDEAVEVYLNGQKIFSDPGFKIGYAYYTLNPLAQSAFRVWKNILAVHCRNSGGGQYIDVGLQDPGNTPGDELITTCGQPNLVRGPNGFEWWMVYFGIFNGKFKSQAVDRVLFFDRTLFVDGPTTAQTSGYHPAPAMPTFRDLFNEGERSDIQDKWKVESGTWILKSGMLIQSQLSGSHEAFIRSQPAQHYLFECSVNLAEFKQGRAGVVAWSAGENNWLKIGLDQAENAWLYALCEDGMMEEKKFPLHADFNPNVFHSFRILNNAGLFEVFLDEIPAPGQSLIQTSFTQPGIPGLFTEDLIGVFDAMIYTIGWDEYDSGIQGWGDSLSGEKARGNWHITDKGLKVEASRKLVRVFKGDALSEYEFMVQVMGPEVSEQKRNKASGGIYPVYCDKSNWLNAEIFPGNNLLRVTGKLNGKNITPVTELIEGNLQSLNLRAIKKRDEVILQVNGVERIRLKKVYPPSQVGLFAMGTEAIFNGMTLFQVGK